MKKGLRRMYLAFLSPVVIAFLIAYLYPVLRTVQMSFFEVSDISAARDTWEFVGLYNYVDLFSRQLFRVSFKNMMLIFLAGGAAVCVQQPVRPAQNGVRGAGPGRPCGHTMDKHSIRVLVHAHRFLLLQHRRQPAGVHGRHEKDPGRPVRGGVYGRRDGRKDFFPHHPAAHRGQC